MMVIVSVKKRTQIIAQWLLMIFLLENCHNPNVFIDPYPQGGTTPVTSHLMAANSPQGDMSALVNASSINYNDTAQLLQNQPCTAQGGYQVTFQHHQEKGLQANIERSYGKGTTQQTLPTIIDTDLKCSQAAIQNPAWQKHHIHIMPHCVYVGQMGLLGGMVREEDQGGKEEQEAQSQPAKTESEQKIEKVQEFVQQATKNAEEAQGKDIVLVLGNTGAGKSTIINYLLGNKMKKIPVNRRKFRIEPENPKDNLPGIGHSQEAHTFFPNVYGTSSSPIVYCDCPGFEDNRTNEIRLNTTIATQMMVNTAKSIQGIIVVIDTHDLDASKGKAIRQISLTLSQLLKGVPNPNSILFIFNEKTDAKINYQEDIHPTIEEIQKAELRKLTGLEAIDTSASNIDNKEYEATAQIVSILSMIESNQERAFAIDVLDNFESKAHIESLLRGVDSIPKENFGFSEYDDTRAKFDKQLAEVVGNMGSKLIEFIQNSKNIVINQEFITSCTSRISFHQAQLKKLEITALANSANTNEEIKTLEKEVEKYENRTKDLEIEKQKIQDKIKNLTKDKKLLDTDEEVLHWQDHCTLNAYGLLGTFFGTTVDSAVGFAVLGGGGAITQVVSSAIDNVTGGLVGGVCAIGASTIGISIKDTVITPWIARNISKDFEYSGVCFSRVERSSVNGNFTNEKENKDQGIYKGTFRISDIRKPSNATVSISVKKKDMPFNVGQIHQIEKELKEEQKKADKYSQEIEEIKQTYESTKETISFHKNDTEKQKAAKKSRVNEIKQQIARVEREKKDLEAENEQLVKKLEVARAYIASKESLLKSILSLITQGICKESGLIKSLQENYKLYQDL